MKDYKTAIIIPFKDLSWLTINCLKSIVASTDIKNIKLYLINNNSSVEESEKLITYLHTTKLKYQHVVMSENLGFVRATNLGLREAIKDGFEYFVMLNNDTIVTKDWLKDLHKHLKDDICFVNPMSSPPDWRETVMGKALIEEQPDYEKVQQSMEAFASHLRQNFADDHVDVDFVPFFCTLINKRVIDTIGVLSEEYDLGLFDDDDYCHRARHAGLKLAVAQGVYVHHFHNSTFIDQNVDYMKLLERNRKVFENKYQYDPWDRLKVKQ